VSDDADQRLWARRLRWRMRGAWQWPTFALITLADAVVLHLMPFAGEGIAIVPAALVACFFNLLAVAILAPVGGLAVRHRRPGLPKIIADDYAGTALLVAVGVAFVAGGVAHRPSVVAEQDAFAAQSAQVRRYVAARAPAEFRANIDRANTWKQGPDLYRTCVPGPDPRKHFCMIVNTDQSPPGIVVDRDQQPNSRIAGPDNPGRKDP
jgi:hypothetical protein